jgi:hypothetical protein
MKLPTGDRSTPPSPGVGGEGRLRRQTSIATLVVIFLVIIATCMLVGMGWSSYHEESLKERAKLQQSLVTEADQLSAGLSLPLWNFDYSQVGKILDSAMHDRSVYGVIVEQVDPADTQEFMTYARIRDPQWRSIPTEFDIPIEGFQVEERTITAMGEPIGRVRILLTTRFLEQELRQRLVKSIAQTLVFDLLLIASLYLLLWNVVLKPLRTLERYATAVKTGGADATGPQVGEFSGRWSHCCSSVSRPCRKRRPR